MFASKYNNNVYMASLNQLISEIAHSVQQADSVPVRRAIRLGIIHARNEAIRRDYSNHNYTDKVLQQRFRLSLIDVPDGDVYNGKLLNLPSIKRTNQKVPRPTRLGIDCPFHSVRTAGVSHPVEIAFIKEASSRYYKSLPGMGCSISYDYINDYIYIDLSRRQDLQQLGSIVVESVFELPHTINIETNDQIEQVDDDDEFLLPEDMINTVKKLFFETFNPEVIRQTNEIPNPNLVE